MKIAFVVMTEHYKHQAVYTLLKMAESALKKGHIIVGIFFFGTGIVNLRKKNHLGTNMRNIPSEFERLAENKVPIYACQTWADIFGLDPEDLISNAKITGLGELTTMVHEAEKVVVFGSRA